jgi:NADH-quinone oxidoreductase subunit L
MLKLLWLVPSLPLVGFALLVFGRLPRRLAACVGVGSIGLAALMTLLIALPFLSLPAEKQVFRQLLWDWFSVAELNVGFTLYLDPLSLVMMGIITGIGFLIHLYSVGYMADDVAFSRFFAYMNLFVAAMLLLVLGDNLVVLYLGWEGVGLCSYLLIGFWYDNPDNGYAARKAFIVTRIGDTSMALGLFLIFMHLETLDIQSITQQATALWLPGSWLPVLAAALLLGGALGKSAQLPLQTWLPDAMAGPTPISALIHAATMVTAGVYLIARMHELFLLAPQVMVVIAIIGAATLLISGFTALTQTDIKRILAFSTMSQLGYMFLALGVGAWSAAIFHLMTHAFFKALLFLAAGAVIISVHHEQNIFKMGGLRKRLPLSFWCFMIGGLALVALPLTSGYFSKHEILLATAAFEHSGEWLWLAGVVGALITGIYTFRLIFIVFFGEEKGEALESFGMVIRLPLLVLCGLSLLGGWIPLPFAQLFPALPAGHGSSVMNWITTLVPIVGIVIAYLCFYRRNNFIERISTTQPGELLKRFWFSGWGFDWLYETFVIAPFMFFVDFNKNDVVDSGYRLIAWLTRWLHRMLSITQTGRVRWYAAVIVLGVVGFVGLGLMR